MTEDASGEPRRTLRELFFGKDSIQDWRRGLITLFLGTLLVLSAKWFWPWTPMQIRADVDSSRERIARVESVVTRIAEVVELHATIASSDPVSPEYQEAVRDLKKLRRVRILEK